MTRLLDEAVARAQALPEEEQDLAAQALLAFVDDRRPCALSAAQIQGVEHALRQADRGEWASRKEVRAIFGRDF